MNDQDARLAYEAIMGRVSDNLESHQQQKFVIEEYRKENERLRQASALDPATILNQ